MTGNDRVEHETNRTAAAKPTRRGKTKQVVQTTQLCGSGPVASAPDMEPLRAEDEAIDLVAKFR